MRGLQSIALYGLAKWTESAISGLMALDLLPRGGLWWCRTIEKLFNVMFMLDRMEEFERLVQIFRATLPYPEAQSAYACATSYLISMFGFAGARDRANSVLDHLQKTSGAALESDAQARAWVKFGHAWFVHTLNPDPYFAMCLADECVQTFARTQMMHHLSYSKSILGLTQADLGGFIDGITSLRSALSIATQAGDPFLVANAQAYLETILIDLGTPEALDEAERLAAPVILANVHPGYTGLAHMALSAVALARGQALEAEAMIRRAIELFRVVPGCVLWPLPLLMSTLRHQGRAGVEEAVAVAKEGFEFLAKLGGAGFMEVPFRVAAAETLHASGDIEGATRALEEALKQIQIRADKIVDPVWRERYLTNRPENVRAFKLAYTWANSSFSC
jgi:tetratricopeptide (TPR) repeat protein